MRRAAIYTRQSSDPDGRRLGVTRQREDCEKKAANVGWEVASVYEDNDKSATNGTRPQYRRLLADIEAGVIDAVVVWDLDRLHRRPIELEHFIDLADRHGIALASVGGPVDLSTAEGRLHARIKGSVARHEIEHKSARQKRANQQKAEQGRPPAGRRCFGYAPGGMEVVEAEAAEVRRAAEALLAGAAIRQIARDMALPTSTGHAWDAAAIRRMLKNPRYAALRVHRGEVVGPAAWAQILDAETHYALIAELAKDERHRAGPAHRYLLSGIATCAVCGAPAFGNAIPSLGPRYRCSSRQHFTRSAPPVDNHVTDIMIARLSSPDAVEMFADRSDRDEAAELRADEGRLRRRLDGLAEAFAAGEIDRRQLRAGSERLRTQLDRVGHRLSSLTRSPVVAAIVTANDVRAAWEEYDVDRRRAVIREVMDIRIHPPGPGRRPFDPTTVEITWK